ncbi:MAG: thioredoxin domain-containing protein [Gemmatimonadaceae bacterium]|nr:thioredoxin domain-containing protein [Gemmatimonadaceae bacterium]
MAKWVDTTANIVLAVSAATVAVLLLLQPARTRAPSGSRPPADVPVADAGTEALNGLFPASVRAGTRMVVFVDVECPYCARYHETVDRISRELPGVSVEIAHFPLPQHRFARSGALALECAREFGHLEAFLTAAYATQDSLGLLSWAHLANRTPIDSGRFRGCIESGRYEATVARHLEVAHLIGVRGTPTVVVGATMFGRPPSFEELARLVGGEGERQ